MLITGVRTSLLSLAVGIIFISDAPSPASAAVVSSREGPATKDYLILPTDDASSGDKKAFGDKLEKAVGDKNKIYTSVVECCGIGLWSAPLTDQQVIDLGKEKGVESIDEDVEESWSRFSAAPQSRNLEHDVRSTLEKRAITHEKTSLGEMLFISQPKGTDLGLLEYYNFEESAGKEISLYIIDSGANTDHPEYMGIPNKRWIFANWWKSLLPGSKSDTENHGSCVLAKAAGPTLGVARNADVVIVKGSLRPSSMLDSFYKVRNDVVKNKKQGKAVVNFSASFGNTVSDENKVKWTAKYLKPLIDNDVILVFAAGNDATHNPNIDEYPQTAANTLPIINVGSCNDGGETSSFSQGGSLLSVLAPGDNIRCATNQKDNKYGLMSGTSFAAPTVAGLAAYFLAIPKYKDELQEPKKVAENVKGLIEKLAWPRHTFKAIYNDQAEYTALAQTATSSTPRPTPTPGPAVLPSATCSQEYKVVLFSVKIENMKDFNQDGKIINNKDIETPLRKEIDGCGKISKWKFHTGTGGDDAKGASVTFDINLVPVGCIGRAIKSAGGPSMTDGSCVKG